MIQILIQDKTRRIKKMINESKLNFTITSKLLWEDNTNLILNINVTVRWYSSV